MTKEQNFKEMEDGNIELLFVTATSMLSGVIDLLQGYIEGNMGDDCVDQMYKVLNIVDASLEKLNKFEAITELQFDKNFMKNVLSVN
jgi:hypothetical protein